ncbi:MAG: hypothetical protein GXY09_04450 [Bacteroidales bacterium]|nr:hypothetical protein [Bacteroidales bacterium]
MDFGDWVFYGLIIASVVGSVVKSVKKKQADAAGQEEDTGAAPTNDGSEWVKNIVRETTKNLFDMDDDDFIPRNPKPAPAASRSTTVTSAPERSAGHVAEDYRRTNQSAEAYRRTNQSAERFTRPTVSLEDKYASKAGQSSKLKHPSAGVEPAVVTATPSLLAAGDDLDDVQEVRKALIYGEIMRPKF